MRRKTIVWLAIGGLLLYTAAIGAACYLIGYQTAEKETSGIDPYTAQTFYAVISDIQGETVTVQGMEINDINFRGAFSFSVTGDTKITYRYTAISLADLDVNDRVSVTFTGDIMESYPARIGQVIWIQLLDDTI